MRTLELHLIQTYAPNRLNRGENGDPKTSVVGGVTRTRFSSQSQKRAQREHSAQRTRVPHQLVLGHIAQDRDLHGKLSEGVSADVLRPVVMDLMGARYGSYDDKGRLKVMTYLSGEEVANFALRAVTHADTLLSAREATLVEGAKKADLKAAAETYQAALQEALNDYRPQVDEQHALYGRFMADLPEELVPAATAYAHAISTHRDQTVNDFFSAVDDVEGGSAHIGNMGLSAPTMYRCAVLDLDLLTRHLGEARALDAARRWAAGFVHSSPKGGQNGAYAHTLPEYALLVTRDHGHPVTLANAFSEPAYPHDGQTLLEVSVQKLKGQLAFNQTAYGENGLTAAREVRVRDFPHDFEIQASPSIEAALEELGF